MIRCFAKQQLYHSFRKYHRNVNYEIVLKDKSKIDGAYLLLKRYKNRLKNYDTALERLESKKVDRPELEAVIATIDKDKGATIFRDFQLLMDSTVQHIEGKFIAKCNTMQNAY